MDRTPLSFEKGDRVYFQEQTVWQMGSQVEAQIQILSKLNMMDIFCILKTRAMGKV